MDEDFGPLAAWVAHLCCSNFEQSLGHPGQFPMCACGWVS